MCTFFFHVLGAIVAARKRKVVVQMLVVIGVRHRVWNDSCNGTAVHLEHRGHFDGIRSLTCVSTSRRTRGSTIDRRPRTDSCDFEVISPSDQERRLVLPMKRGLEEFGSWAVWWSVNVAEDGLATWMVYFDSLCRNEWLDSR